MIVKTTTARLCLAVVVFMLYSALLALWGRPIMLKDVEAGIWEAIRLLSTGCDSLWGLTGIARAGYDARLKLNIYILGSLLREVEWSYASRSAPAPADDDLTAEDYTLEEALFIITTMREELGSIWLILGSQPLFLHAA